MQLWKQPDSWFGQPWDGWYVFLGKHRDSDQLTISNYETAWKELSELPSVLVETPEFDEETESIQKVCESHWAVGWIEWIAIHPTNEAAVKLAEEMEERLENYPVLDEEDFSNREWEEYQESWDAGGAWDFKRELKKAFGLNDILFDLLDEADNDTLREFFESCISSGEYYIEGYPNIDDAVKECTRDHLAQFLRRLHTQAKEVKA